MSVPVNFRLKNTRSLEIVDKIAAATGRDRSYILNEALEEYASLYEWQVAETEQGLAEHKAGQHAPQSEIDALLGRKK